MSKFLKTLITITLALCLSMVFIACNDGDGDTQNSGDATTGEFVYELETGEDDAGEEYEYYKITGYTVTSDDALKMAQGDFSSVEGKRDIVIPNEYNGKPVEEIGAAAFADRIIIKTIKFETDTNVKTIGSGAFSGCANLEEIINLPFIGKSADAVGEERVLGFVFGSGSSIGGLTSVTAKAYDEASATDLTFQFPEKLRKVSLLGDKVTECAFYGMTMIEEITFANAKYIGASAFNGCISLTSLDLSSATFINANAFSGCSSLQRVTFGNDLTHIGASAFAGCGYLGYNYATDAEDKIQIVIPNSVTYLGSKAFSDCTLLKYIVLGDGITEIKTGTFANCSELTKVTAKIGVEIQASAFAGCNKDVLKVNGAKPSDLAFGEYDLA